MFSRTFLINLFNKGKFFFYTVLVEKGVYFLVYVYLARISSVEAYGDLTAIFVFTNILNALFEFGFAPYFQREAASKHTAVTHELNIAITFKGWSFALYVIITVIYFWIVGTTMTIAVALIIIAMFINSISGVLSRILFGLDKYNDSFYSLFISRLLLFAGMGILLFLPLPYYGVLSLLLCSMILQLILLIRNLEKINITFSNKFDIVILQRILTASLPMGIGILFVWGYDKMDVLLIQRFLGNESVSYYSVAYSIYKVPQILTGVVLTPLYTTFSKQFGGQGRLNTNAILNPALLLLGVSIMMVLGVNLFSKELLIITFGGKYTASAWILTSLSVALPALFLNNLTGVLLNSIRHEQKAMFSAFYAFILNIGLNIFLLPVVGVFGAVIATVCAEYGILFIQLIYLKNSKKILWQTITL